MRQSSIDSLRVHTMTPNQAMQRPLALAALLFLAACHHSDRDAEAKQQRERGERFDKTLEHFTTQHTGAVRFDTREAQSMFRKLTIDAQDAIAAKPNQLYWSISSQFDIYREASGAHLLLRAISDHWVLLSCTETQVADIRKQRRADRTSASFVLAYTLLSASPLHVELRGSSSGTGEDVSVAVAADEISGRVYTGRLADFELLDEGEPIETP
jgi:hypothetical protein